jgi:hypothetical protein
LRIAGADIVYPVGSLLISSAFDEDSQSLAGGIFNVATRVRRVFLGFSTTLISFFNQLGTSLGMAITSSIATNVSRRYSINHPSLPPNSPEVLMAGFRAGGWVLFGAAALSIIIGLIGLRGVGIVGRQKTSDIAQSITTEGSEEKDTDTTTTKIVLELSV